MNERIREHAEHAGKLAAEHCNDTMDKFGIKLVFQDVFNEKFAALIVQESTNIVLHYADVYKGVAVARKHFDADQ